MFSESTKTAKQNQGGLTNRIVKSTSIKGEIISNTDFRIDGKLDGEIKVLGKLVVGKTGIVTGKIECDNIDIEGSVNGNILVKGLLSLKSSASVEGEVITEKFAVEYGAIFNAVCQMKSKTEQGSGSTLKPFKKEIYLKGAKG